MIKACQVQHAMQHENANFIEQGMAVLCGLRGSAFDGDGHFAHFGWRVATGKGEHVRGIFAVQKLAVQAKQLAIAAHEAGERTVTGYLCGEAARKLLQAAFFGAR
jgi:hypothetical protein